MPVELHNIDKVRREIPLVKRGNLTPACPVKYLARDQRSGFNWGRLTPLTYNLSPHFQQCMFCISVLVSLSLLAFFEKKRQTKT
jgi:hypothetical protein